MRSTALSASSLSLPTLEQIEAELERRRIESLSASEREVEQQALEKQAIEARASMLAFVKFVRPRYRANWHHEHICEKLDAFVRGDITRLIIEAPPRNGKSELASRALPAYIFGKNTDAYIIASSYGADLAQAMNRDVQRIMDTQLYQLVFPDTRLNSANIRTVCGSWLRNSDMFEVVNHSGTYVCAGVGGPITGKGANYAIIDDPIKNQEEADSPTYREKVWEWYTSTLYTRMEGQPQGILLMLCMTGDTPVLMEDGSEKLLRDVRRGDRVATYDDGRITWSVVRDWRPQGADVVYTIRMKSGTVVRANARHPFLAHEKGETKWLRTDSVRKGSTILRVIGASGAESHAQKTSATSQSCVKGCASRTIKKSDGKRECAHLLLTLGLGARRACVAITGSVSRSMRDLWPSRAAFASYAENHQRKRTLARIGMASSASTIATLAERFAGFFATIATSWLAMGRPKRRCSQQQNTYEVVHDVVVDTFISGVEEVFDLQIDRTENFIANGLISHNTRWHEDDLAGRVLARAEADKEADQWTVVSFPAIKEGPPTADDPRQEGEALWPDRFPIKQLHKIRASTTERVWSSLYQQRPAPTEGGILKRVWWRFWYPKGAQPPPVERVKQEAGTLVEFVQVELPETLFCHTQSWDMAFKDTKDSAYVVGQVWAQRDANSYLLDQVREKLSFTASVEAVRSLSARWPQALKKLVEDKANGPAVISTLQQEIPGLIPVDPKGGKETRANAASPSIKSGNVYLPHPALFPWVRDFIEECAAFPNGKYADQVDSMTQYLCERYQTGASIVEQLSRWR